MKPRPPAVVIGAGPYGLSIAAELGRLGIDTRVFGRLMSFWEEHMPAGMFLRSRWDASHIGRPAGMLSLGAYEKALGRPIARPIPVEEFVSYGRWVARSARIHVEERSVSALWPRDGGVELAMDDGETVIADRVIVAAGIREFAWRPEELRTLPSELASHSSQHRTFAPFAGRRVTVVGGGQSAIESGALLAEAGATVEVLMRGEGIRWLRRREWLLRHAHLFRSLLYPRTDVGPVGLNLLVANPRVFGAFPRSLQERIARRAIRPAVAAWLTDRLRGVTITTGARVVGLSRQGGEIRMRLADGSERSSDHLICATGFRVDVGAYPFIPRSLAQRIATRDGLPALNAAFESSVPRLHFLGAASAGTFGPVMRFVSGTDFASTSLGHALLRERDRSSRARAYSGVALFKK
jgi:glycine/D-amino acid oxidase-like deaminating enzyme